MDLTRPWGCTQCQLGVERILGSWFEVCGLGDTIEYLRPDLSGGWPELVDWLVVSELPSTSDGGSEDSSLESSRLF